MTDIVERLRQHHTLNNFAICDEAADEIEKLRLELEELSHVRAQSDYDYFQRRYCSANRMAQRYQKENVNLRATLDAVSSWRT